MKIQGCHFILQVKFYIRPTRYGTILFIADTEKNHREEQQVNFRAVIIEL